MNDPEIHFSKRSARRGWLRPWVLLIATLGLGASNYGAEPLRDSAFADKGEGKALVEDLLTRRPPENTEILGLLKMRPMEGSMIEVPIKMVVRVTAEGWEDIYQTQPVGPRLGEIFVVRHHGTKPSEYLFGEFEKPKEAPHPQPIEASQLFRPLAGLDFFLVDLGMEFLHWPSQKIIKKEMRKSRSCRVVESTNPHPSPESYARVLSWIDFETGNLVMAQAYDASNRLLKEFSIRKISRDEGKVQLKEIEMRNEQTDARTRLEFNLELPKEAEQGPVK